MDRSAIRSVARAVLLPLGLAGCCPPSAPPPEVYASAGPTSAVRSNGLPSGSQRASILGALVARGLSGLDGRSPQAPRIVFGGEVVVEAPDGIYIGYPVGPTGQLFWTFCYYEELLDFEMFVLGLARHFGAVKWIVLGGYGYPSSLRLLDPVDLTYRSFTGLPPSVTVTDLAAVDLDGNGKEEIFAVYQSSGAAPGGVAQCDPETASCQLLNGFPPFPSYGSGPTSIHTISVSGSSALDSSAAPSAAPRAIVVSTTSGILRSADAGATWQPSTGLSANLRVDDLEAAGLEAAGSALFAVSAAGLFRSLDEGASFAPVSGAATASAIGTRGVEVWVGLTGTPASVLRSSDGGQTFTAGGSLAPARRVNSLAVRDTGLYALTDAGAFTSTDGGSSWTVSNEGLTNASFGSLALGADGSIVAGGGGGYDGIVVSRDRGDSWARGAGADYRTVNALAVSGTNVIAATNTGTIRSLDGGATFTSASPSGLTGGAIRSLAVSGSTILAGLSSGSVHRSTDGGASFSTASSGLPAGGGAVTELAASGTLVLAGRSDGVHRSTDGGATFVATSIVATSGSTFVTTALALSGSEALVAAQSFTSTSFANILRRSTDGGATFQDITAGIGSTNTLFSLAISGNRLFASPFQGVLVSEDGGATWRDLDARLSRASIGALLATSDRLHVATRGSSLWSLPLTPRESRLVPIVLDVGSGAARFTTELALTNRGTTEVTVTARYTASLGAGSGSGVARLAAGQQLVLPDAITWLKGLGVPIAEGTAAGTLLLDFDGVSSPGVVAATARTGAGTSAPQPEGKAGLAYPGFDPAFGAASPLTVYGLRQSDADRSNLAVFSVSDEPVTVRVTAFSGTGDGRTAVIAEETLPPRGWKQHNAVLATAGMTTGWVTVTRTSSTGSFGCYGIVNDNGTNDGSFVFPVTTLVGGGFLNVPVLVEAGAFRSELVLANASPAPATFRVTYRESLAGSGGGSASIAVPARTQLILPDALQALRDRGVAVGAPGGSYAGSLRVELQGVDAGEAFAGARTAAVSSAAGQFGLFTPALYPGEEAASEAWLYGLVSGDTSRANVAVASTAASEGSAAITLELTAYDGDRGGVAAGEPTLVTLQPGQWTQIGDFLRGKGVANGWVRVRRTEGSAPWLAYGVVNDGGRPGERTGDGAYVPMTR